MQGTRLERAIGVVYHPYTERWSHYFQAAMADQFDMVVHHDVTQVCMHAGDVTQVCMHVGE